MSTRTYGAQRDGVVVDVVADDEGIVSVTCRRCDAALVDDDRSPYYDAATDDGTPHACAGTIKVLVEDYVKATKALDGIEYRLRTGQAGGRNAGATDAAIAAHGETQRRVIETLVRLRQRRVVGLLVEQASVKGRLRLAARDGQERPELTRRLADTRKALRVAVGASR